MIGRMGMGERFTKFSPIYNDWDEHLFAKFDLENKKLLVKEIHIRDYSDLEEDAENIIDFKELWKNEVSEGYTEDSLDEWIDTNKSNLISDFCNDNDRDREVEGDSDIQSYLERYGWSYWFTVYYDTQVELKGEESFTSFEEFKEYYDNYSEYSDWDSLSEEVQLEIQMFFEQDFEYRFIP